MKKHIVTIMALMALVTVGAGAQAPEAQEVKSMLRLVADWERANHLIDEGEHGDLAWTQAALYVGMLDWAEVAEREDGDDSYYQWIRRIGRRNSWQTGKMMYHADDIAVSQAWLTMYEKYRERNMLLPTLARTEFVLRYPSCSTLELDYTDGATLERWSWCDALFMAPPVYARMYVLTGRPEFLEFMDREYKATYEYLYDKEARLFYRDWRYFDNVEANGEKVFWGRGNGWVWPAWRSCCRFSRRQTPTGISTRTFSWIWSRDWPGFRVLTATGTRACWIRRHIPRPRPARPALSSTAWPTG